MAAAAAAPQERQAGGGLGFIILQLGVAYFLFTTFIKGRGGREASAPTINASDASSFGQQVLSATAIPAPTPPEPVANLFAMFGIPDPSKVTTKTVDPALKRYDEDRAAALAAIPASAKLPNLWRNGQRFDLFVFLSTDAAPIRNFSALERVYSGTAAENEDVVEQPSSGGSPPTVSLFGGLMQRFVSSQSGVTRRLVNRTFTGLLDGAGGEGGDGDPSAPVSALIWAQRGLSFDWAPTNPREQLINVSLPASVLANATGVYAHVYFVTDPGWVSLNAGMSPSGSVIRIVHPLVTLLKRKPVKATYNLLEGSGVNASSGSARSWGIGATAAAPTQLPQIDGDAGEELVDSAATSPAVAAAAAATTTRILPYWRPALSIELIHDFSVYSKSGLPPHVSTKLQVTHGPSGVGYTPLAWINTFWVLGHHLIPINGTTPVVPLTLSYSTGALWKWAMQAQMEAQWAMQESMGTSSGGEADMCE